MKRKPLIDEDGEVRELTEEDLRAFRPSSEVLSPELYAILTNRKPGESGPRRAGKYFVEIVTIAYPGFLECMEPRVIGRVELDEPGGEVRLVDCGKLEEHLRNGILGPGGNEAGLIRMGDGMKFLEALQWEFKGSYVWATGVQMETGEQAYPGVALEVKFSE